MGMFDNQGTFPVTLLFWNVNETHAHEMLKLYEAVSNSPRTRPDLFPVDLKNLIWSPPYSSQDWGNFVAQYPFDRENDHVRNFVIARDMITTLGVPGICSGDGDPAVGFEYFNRWPALFRQPYIDAMAVAPFEGRFSHLYNESLGDVREGKIWRKLSDLPLLFSERVPMDQSLYYLKFYITDASEDEDITRAIRAVSSILRASRFNDGSLRHWQLREREEEVIGDVAACGPTYTQYKGLEDMEHVAMAAFQVVVVVGFIFSWMLLGFRLATAHMLSSLMLWMEIWGIVMSFVKLNVFSLVAIAFTTSLAPVFSSDLATAMKQNPELAPEQRLGSALRVALPAMCQGSLCMLGALLPLLASPFPLIVENFAVPSIITVLLGVLHGSIISPAFLALLAQNEIVPTKSFEDAECVGVAVEVPALQGGPNLLLSAASGQLDKSK